MRSPLAAVMLAAGCWTAPVATPPARLASAPAAAGPRCIRDVTSPGYSAWLEAGVAGRGLRACLLGDRDPSADSESGDDIGYADDERRSPRVACVGVDPRSGRTFAQPNESEPAPERESSSATAVQACSAAGACRPIGPALAKAIADKPDQVTISADGALVATDGELWNVAADRTVALAAPADVGIYKGVSVSFLGDLVIGAWTPCAGPCTEYRVFQRDGTLVLDGLHDSTALAALPDRRFAMFDGDLGIFDSVTGELLASVDVRGAAERVYGNTPDGADASDPIVVLPDGSVALVMRVERALAIAIVDVGAARVIRRIRVPFCGA